MYDYKTGSGTTAAAALVDRAVAVGATSFWVEPSRWTTAPIWAPAELGAMVDRAQQVGLPVVLWTLPGFKSVEDDLAKVRAASEFRGPRGGRAVMIGLDVEVPDNAAPAVRTERLVALLRRVRTVTDLPIVAIPPNPVGMARRPEYWPGFPWAEIARRTDAVAPMGYWSFRKDDPVAYSRAVVDGVRDLVGPRPPIHLVGGLAEDTSAAGYRAFCAYAHRAGLVGVGIYDLSSMKPGTEAGLAACRTLG